MHFIYLFFLYIVLLKRNRLERRAFDVRKYENVGGRPIGRFTRSVIVFGLRSEICELIFWIIIKRNYIFNTNCTEKIVLLSNSTIYMSNFNFF